MPFVKKCVEAEVILPLYMKPRGKMRKCGRKVEG